MTLKYSPVISSGKVSISLKSLSSSGFNYPIFCFRHLHPNFGLEECLKESDKRFIKGLLDKLRMLSQQNWFDLQLKNWQHGGSEMISVKQLNVALPPAISGKDIIDVTSFYFAGDKARIIGYRNENVFHTIFIDTKLKVYDH